MLASLCRRELSMSEKQQSSTQGSGSEAQQGASSQPEKKSAPVNPPATDPSKRTVSRNDGKDGEAD